MRISMFVLFSILGDFGFFNPGEESPQEMMALKAKQMGARIRKNAQGAVESAAFVIKTNKVDFVFNDEDVKTIDFTMFPQLKFLTIYSMKMTDASLVHLSKNQFDLLDLFIAGGQMTDVGFTALLKTQKKLRTVAVINCPLTDKALLEIGRNVDIDSLAFAGTRITDSGLRHLARLGNVQFLNISHTNISDEGIPELIKISNLKVLMIDGTKITDQGVQRLTDALPNLKVVRKR
jgi:hypothetical protein